MTKIIFLFICQVNNINENLELSEDDEIDLDEINKKHYSTNTNKKTVRYEKPKAAATATPIKQNMRPEVNGSSSAVGIYHAHADTLHSSNALQPHHHQHSTTSHTQNQVRIFRISFYFFYTYKQLVSVYNFALTSD